MAWKQAVEEMSPAAWAALTRCLFLTCFFLFFGCLAIWEGRLDLADRFRELSSLSLLAAVLLPPYIERFRG